MGFALSEIEVRSTAFGQGGAIPSRNTGEGDDLSPALTWRNAPSGTRAFAIFCHDPDAPLVAPNGTYGFVHWVLYNVPASVDGLAEGSSDHTAGRNDFGRTGYGGPMPPKGHGRHHYFFWVLALDEDLRLEPGLGLTELLARVEGHTIGMNRLVGTYERS